MSLTPSTMLPLGTTMPEFSLPEPATGKTISSSDIKKGNLVLVVFICNHCPYVIHIADQLAEFAMDYKTAALSIFGINSNNVERYPEDSPEKMIDEVKKRNYIFPYLYDETQQTARAFHAACTPDFFLFDKDHKLVYRGQFDDSRPGNNKSITGKDLRHAVDLALKGESISQPQLPSMGCNIKWK